MNKFNKQEIMLLIIECLKISVGIFTGPFLVAFFIKDKIDESVNKIFTANNMFPGDAVSKKYVLNISHKENIDVMFKAKVQAGFETLAEVLKLKITVHLDMKKISVILLMITRIMQF